MILSQVSAGRHIKSALSRNALGRIASGSNRIYIRLSESHVSNNLQCNIHDADCEPPAQAVQLIIDVSSRSWNECNPLHPTCPLTANFSLSIATSHTVYKLSLRRTGQAGQAPCVSDARISEITFATILITLRQRAVCMCGVLRGECVCMCVCMLFV